MSEQTKSVIAVFAILFVLFGIAAILLSIIPNDLRTPKEIPVSEPNDPNQSVFEGIKDIQRQVGCVKIDGKIGPETIRMVKLAIVKEDREFCNQQAAKFFPTTAIPKVLEDINKSGK